MADSATTRNKFRKQSLNSNTGTWGDPNLNTTLDNLDEALDGFVEIAVTGTDVTLTTDQYATNEARQRMLKITGTLTADLAVIIPDLEKWYIVWDATTLDGNTLTIKNTSGTGVTPTNAQREIIICDASETYKVEAGNTLSSIGAPTSNVDFAGFRLTSLGTPSAATDGSTKGYVDAQISAASILPLSNDWGNVTIGTTVQRKRDTDANIAAYTGPDGELVVNTTNRSIHIMDGSTAGGTEIARSSPVGLILALG
jgi:hypothetical protein